MDGIQANVERILEMHVVAASEMISTMVKESCCSAEYVDVFGRDEAEEMRLEVESERQYVCCGCHGWERVIPVSACRWMSCLVWSWMVNLGGMVVRVSHDVCTIHRLG